MKAKITKAYYNKEVTTNFGIFFEHIIEYDGKQGHYLSKSKEQKYFIENKECEFDEIISENWIKVKPISQQKGSNYSRAVKKEQSRYSGFAMSYAKDLVIHDKIELKDLSTYTKLMFNLMVELDKSQES